MFRSTLSRGVSAGALTLALTSLANAQQSLPTIDVGGANRRPAATRGASGRASGNATAPVDAPASAPMSAAAREKYESTAYTRSKAFSATKTNLPIIDTPRSIVVIPKQVLQDTAVLNTQEAVRFASGVQPGLGVYYDSYLIRGFSSGNNTYRNGLKLFQVAGTTDPAFLDRVEVLKGPAAMLYGRIQPGGMVNFVTKKPQEEAAYSLQEQFGSWGLSRTVVDATGPVTQDKSVLYRVIGVYDHSDSFVNFKHQDNGSVLAEAAWRPTTQFEANVAFQYDHLATTNRGYYQAQIPALALSYAVPWRTGRPAWLPRNWTQNDPAMYANLPDVMERELISADWAYHFNDRWKVTNRFHYQHSDENQNYILSRGLNLASGLMNRKVSWGRFYRDTWSLNLDLTGEVETGPIKHNLLFGFDYYDFYSVQKGDNPPGTASPGFPVQPQPPLSIWFPYYGSIPFPVIESQIYQAAGNINSKASQKNYGYYVQDVMSLNDSVYFLIGGRYDNAFDRGSEYFGSTQLVDGRRCFPFCDGHFNPPWKALPTEKRISPNGGLLLKLTPEYSVYVSYSESFANSSALSRSATNKPFPPEEGRQYEAGAKASLFDGKLNASVAAFDLRLKNRLVPDPAFPNTNFAIAAGTVRNRGIEFDIGGQATDNISLIGSYAYYDAIIIDDTTTGTGALLGKRWAGVPRHTGNLWAKYDTAPGQKEGWAFGAGFFAKGWLYGNNTNSWLLPAYVTFDMMAGYRTVVEGFSLEAQLNVKNIGDAKYFEGTDGGLNAWYGAPRTFIGSLKVKF
jgi:iron complex outermembrane receptor protein